MYRLYSNHSRRITVPKVKSPKATDPRLTELRLQLEGFKLHLIARRGFLESIATSLRAKVPDSPVLGLITNIVTDIKRTMDSSDEYLKKVSHFDDLLEPQKVQMLELVPKTIDAALLVIDRRFIQAIELFTQMYPKKAVGAQKVIGDYLVEMGLERSKRGSIDLDAKLRALDNPYRPHFSQTFAEDKFGATQNVATSSLDIIGKPVLEVGQLIRENPLKREQINVGVFFHNGVWISMNNRSLAAACCSGVEPRLEVIFPDEAFIGYYADKIKQDVLRDPFSIRLEDKATKASPAAVRHFQRVSVPDAWSLVGVTTPTREALDIGPTKSDSAREEVAVVRAPLEEARERMELFRAAVPQPPEGVENLSTPAIKPK